MTPPYSAPQNISALSLDDSSDPSNSSGPSIQSTFIPYIKDKMTAFAAYDAQRPKGHPYAFHTHSERVAQSMKHFALSLGWKAETADILYWATLPHDIGKMSLPITIWDSQDKPTAAQKAQRRTHVTQGLAMVENDFSAANKPTQNHPFLTLLRDIMGNHHEALDGSGFLGKTGKNLSLIMRMACICDAFDGWSVWRPHFAGRDLSPQSVLKRMSIEKAGQFDPDLLALFHKNPYLETYQNGIRENESTRIIPTAHPKNHLQEKPFTQKTTR